MTPHENYPLHFDARKHVDNEILYGELNARHGPFWAIIDATGFSFSGSFTKQPWENIPSQIEVNLINPIHLAHSFSPTMREKGGRFIYFSSILAEKFVFGTNIYSVSKLALEKFVSNFALGSRVPNLTMNCIQLGYYDFGMINQVPQEILSSIGELSNFNQIVPTLEFLLSENSSNTSGVVFKL
jgi:NAD(P)-dependent dehydrogenase (short-subunit alcohol dehydrogenase family)